MSRFPRLPLFLAFLGFSLPVFAGGSFTAQDDCEATTNKASRPGAERRNPDQASLSRGQAYPIIDSDRPSDPGQAGWYRVVVKSAQPNQRWVPATCGKASFDGAETSRGRSSGKGGSDQCRTPGLADSYVFAVSWQAAFCEAYQKKTQQTKPECAAATPASWSAGNFTLHGLWPNLSACGTNYGFCSSQPQASAFCAYPEPAIGSATLDKLKVVMPSAGAGSCLQRHEWYKHGTCQTNWDADNYFAIAIQLTEQFNKAGPAAFMSANLGKQVVAKDFFRAIDSGLGQGASQRMKFTCQDGQLVDIYMNLPATIPATPKLPELLQAAKPGFSSNCGERFRVDSIGQ